MTPVELERLLVPWHAVVRAAEASGDAWSADFARSIERQARRRSWRPSAKQAVLMRRAVSDLFNGPGSLIEKD